MSIIIKGLGALHSKIKRDIKTLDAKLDGFGGKRAYIENVYNLRLSLARQDYNDALARATKRFNTSKQEAEADYLDQSLKLDAKADTLGHSRRRLGRINRHLDRALDEHDEDVKLHAH